MSKHTPKQKVEIAPVKPKRPDRSRNGSISMPKSYWDWVEKKAAQHSPEDANVSGVVQALVEAGMEKDMADLSPA